jgi:methyl-accepting chemotaxis protein
MHDIAGVAQQVAVGSKQATTAAEQLNGMANTLARLIEANGRK